MLNNGGHVQNKLFLPFSCQQKSDYPEKLNIHTKGTKNSLI